MTGERLYTGDTVTQLKIGDDDMSLTVSCAGYLSRSRGLVACIDAKDRDGFVGLALTAEEAKAVAEKLLEIVRAAKEIEQ